MTAPLRAVPSGGRRAARVPRSLQSAARKGRRELLVALRDHISADIDAGVAARDLAALSRRLMEISRDLEALDAARSTDDEVTQAADEPDEEWPA